MCQNANPLCDPALKRRVKVSISLYLSKHTHACARMRTYTKKHSLVCPGSKYLAEC